MSLSVAVFFKHFSYCIFSHSNIRNLCSQCVKNAPSFQQKKGVETKKCTSLDNFELLHKQALKITRDSRFNKILLNLNCIIQWKLCKYYMLHEINTRPGALI